MAFQYENLNISGKLGVGTDEPQSRLHIYGGLRLEIGEGLEFLGDDSYFGTGSDARVIRMLDVAGKSAVDGGIAFDCAPAGSNPPLAILAICGSGKVGVGINDPAETLSVAGTLSVSGAATLGSLNVNGDISPTGKVDGRDIGADGAQLDTHLADRANPHGVTAAQVGALVSFKGVSNPGGNIDLITSGALTITPDDAGNRITIAETHSGNRDNPHGVTATQAGALVSFKGVSNPGGNIDLITSGALTITPDDANNRITLAETHSGNRDNPHGVTATQVGAVPTAGGSISGGLTITGNVGIGTYAPKNKLDVEGGAVIGASYSGTKPAPTNGLLVEGNVGIGTDAPKNKLDIEGSAVIGATYAGTNAAPVNGLLVQGKVGIGTKAPQKTLHVKGNAGVLALEGSDHAYLEWYPDGYTAGRKAWLGFGSANANNLTIANEISGAHIVLSPNGGNIGIGKLDPGYKLDVAGDFNVSGGILKDGNITLNIVGIGQEFSDMKSDQPWIMEMKWGIQTPHRVTFYCQAYSHHYGWGNSRISLYYK